jgi:ribonuclease P protein component
MLEKKYKLTRKDIGFIFRKQKVIPWKYFSFFVRPQYPNRKFNQFWFQIPTKVSKRAVKRNFVKRVVYDYIRENNLQNVKFNGYFLKIFIVTNKKTIPILSQILEKKDNVEKKQKVINILKESFKSLKRVNYVDFFKSEKFNFINSTKKKKIRSRTAKEN